MKKNWKRVLLVCMLVIVFLCASVGSPTLSLVLGLSKYPDMETVQFQTDIQIERFDKLSEATETNQLLALKDGQIHIKGSYQHDPSRLEMNLTATLNGPLDREFTMPIIIEGNKLWFNPPQLFGFIPDKISEQYIMKEFKPKQTNDAENKPKESGMKALEHPLFAVFNILQAFNVQENIQYVPKYAGDKESDKLIHVTLQEEEIDIINEKIQEQLENTIAEKSEKTDQERLGDAGKLLLKGFGVDSLTPKDLKEFDFKKFDLKNYDLKEYDWKTKLTDETKQRLLTSFKLEQCNFYFGMKKDHHATNQQSNIVVSYQLGRERAYLRIAAKTTFSNLNKPVEFQIETPTDAIRWDDIVDLLN